MYIMPQVSMMTLVNAVTGLQMLWQSCGNYLNPPCLLYGISWRNLNKTSGLQDCLCLYAFVKYTAVMPNSYVTNLLKAKFVTEVDAVCDICPS